MKTIFQSNTNINKNLTEEKFLKAKFKSYMQINYHPPRNPEIKIECMLIAVDFDEQLLKLQSFPSDIYNEEPFWARYDHCEIEIKSKFKKVL